MPELMVTDKAYGAWTYVLEERPAGRGCADTITSVTVSDGIEREGVL